MKTAVDETKQTLSSQPSVPKHWQRNSLRFGKQSQVCIRFQTRRRNAGPPIRRWETTYYDRSHLQSKPVLSMTGQYLIEESSILTVS
jgi:hypothetical protein